MNESISRQDYHDLHTTMSIEELCAAFRKAFVFVGEGILKLASILQVIIAKNGADNLAELNLGPVSFLRRLIAVAEGRLSEDLLAKHIDKGWLLDRAAQLPLAEQKRIANGGRVLVVCISPTGEVTNEMKDPAALMPHERRLVFDGNHLRDEAAQRGMLDGERTKGYMAENRAQAELFGLTIDRVAGRVHNRHVSYTAAQLKELLAALEGRKPAKK